MCNVIHYRTTIIFITLTMCLREPRVFFLKLAVISAVQCRFVDLCH
eukprot:COSAG01_NODE_2148_length_8299_cov_283.948177_8_plen_46_part_00